MENEAMRRFDNLSSIQSVIPYEHYSISTPYVSRALYTFDSVIN